ncbi:MAG TPA: hypothetical protein VHC72_01095, partial [Bryobacteraceae bacterium]|nr:hypothetical protein [Bryobacteraceae bacterium]
MRSFVKARHTVACLGLFTGFALQAQVGFVQNAATYQQFVSGHPGFTFTGNIYQAGFAQTLLGYVSFPPPSPNVVSPRMLAVLSYPSPQLLVNPYAAPPVASVNATLSIRPVGASAALPVTVTSAVPGAITFVVPGGIPLGGAELLYKIDGQATQWTNVNVVQSSFAFFRTSGNGPAIAEVKASNGSISAVGLTTPAQPGQTLILSGSGLGYGSTVSATIGGIDAPVTYAGPHPTEAGHDQILIPIPAGAPEGCYVPVSLTYNKAVVTTTVSVTVDGSPCRHPWQLSLSDMKTLDSGGSIASGAFGLCSQLNAVNASAASRNESATMSLGWAYASQIASYFLPQGAALG